MSRLNRPAVQRHLAAHGDDADLPDDLVSLLEALPALRERRAYREAQPGSVVAAPSFTLRRALLAVHSLRPPACRCLATAVQPGEAAPAITAQPTGESTAPASPRYRLCGGRAVVLGGSSDAAAGL